MHKPRSVRKLTPLWPLLIMGMGEGSPWANLPPDMTWADTRERYVLCGFSEAPLWCPRWCQLDSTPSDVNSTPSNGDSTPSRGDSTPSPGDSTPCQAHPSFAHQFVHLLTHSFSCSLLQLPSSKFLPDCNHTCPSVPYGDGQTSILNSSWCAEWRRQKCN